MICKFYKCKHLYIMATLSIVSGNPQTTPIFASFPMPFVVSLTINGNPIVGATVVFQTPLTGASCTFTGDTNVFFAFTNSSGQASSSIATANDISGSYLVTASSTGASPANFNLTNTMLCLAYNTRILMFDGNFKNIQDIKRDDLVAGNPSINKIYRVARLMIHEIVDHPLTDITIFQPHSLGVNLPNRKLIISSNHALFWNNARRPAKCFANNPNITRYYNNKIYKDKSSSNSNDTYYIKDLLPHHDHDKYFLYDLQFETIGSYVAEGITVQSRCPQSNITPLPKKLYFDQSLYKTDIMDDNPNHKCPLDFTILNNNITLERNYYLFKMK